MIMGEGRRKGYNEFSLSMSSSLSKKWVHVVENLSRVFLSKQPLLHLWVIRVYIVWVKGKEFTHKNPPGRMFRDCLTGRPYPRDTRENNCLARLFNFQSCASHMATSRVSFSRNPLDLQLSLSFHQLNIKPNQIKSHKNTRKQNYAITTLFVME